jgi:two-component system, NtrC family, sensor histidine kinase PilS
MSDRFAIGSAPAAPAVPPWRWSIGAIRLGLFAFIAAGAFIVGDLEQTGARYLVPFYVFGFSAALWSFFVVRDRETAPRTWVWAQVLVDLGVVAATINFTGGAESFFTFLYVVVILEAGLLLGLSQGFSIAGLAVVAMLIQIQLRSEPTTITIWYNFFIQALAYFLTASISGYWNQQLRRLKQFQREILDNMNNGFMIVDRSGVVTALNTAGLRILGLDDGAGIGRPVTDLLKAESGGECPVITALRSGKDYTRYEFRCKSNGAPSRLLGLSTSRVLDWRRRDTGLIASFSDLTEMDAMRNELQRHDRMAAVGELAAGLAHEIRNPVAAIRGAVDELRSGVDRPSMVRKLADIALRESDHLNKIVSDFLDFARKPVAHGNEFDLNELVGEVADLTRREFDEGAVVETQAPNRAVAVRGDRSQIKQVFINLAKNGMEAMHGEGKLTIATNPNGRWVEVRFEDEGEGIPPDTVAQVFEPFYTTKDDGVGMGLAICQRIVTSHDGVIHATPREGGGTAMSVRLPIAQKKE